MSIETSKRAIKDLVLEEGALAHLFERYGIDYFCQGEESLESACARKGLDIELVLQELEIAKASRPYSFLHTELWGTEFLIEYLVQNHHRYCKETIPIIMTQLATLVKEEGERYTYLKPVMLLFQPCAHEIEQHMRKEEMILFPFIKSLESAAEFRRRRPIAPFITVTEPVERMQLEHLQVVQVLAKIRALLSDYKLPHGASSLYRSSIIALQAFTKDVHQHIHIENNILFPRVHVLEATFDTRTGQPLLALSSTTTRRAYL